MVDVTALKRRWRTCAVAVGAGKILEGRTRSSGRRSSTPVSSSSPRARPRDPRLRAGGDASGFLAEMVRRRTSDVPRPSAAGVARQRDHGWSTARAQDGTTVWLRDIVSVKSSNGEPAPDRRAAGRIERQGRRGPAVRQPGRLSRLVARSPVAIFEIDPRAGAGVEPGRGASSAGRRRR